MTLRQTPPPLPPATQRVAASAARSDAEATPPRDRSAVVALSIVALAIPLGIAFAVSMWGWRIHPAARSDDAWVAMPAPRPGGAMPGAPAAVSTRAPTNDPTVVIARFREDVLPAIRVGQAAQVRLADAADIAWIGHVQAIGAGADADTAIDTAAQAGNHVQRVRRQPVRIVLDRAQAAPATLEPGTAVQVVINTSSAR
ncbi:MULTISPECIES: HlyD family secretion protein [unclassified Xanthomonas]|uniref:hypothetical protein n=1 Tax=Xanthomonas sp. LMG 9002 TaxID=1591158 RepID=UPI00136EC475|nr:hypothetical protein [Xanthomonas sp. LMG 9002]MXV07825.1 hypothetical protein [Xanthomonas sp. LMG 9002]